MHPSTYDQHCGTEQPKTRDSQVLRPAIWLMVTAVIVMLLSAWQQDSQPAVDSYNFLGERHNTRSNVPLPNYARVADPTIGEQTVITDE